jgi:Domain of unknown function (DUF5666)
MHFKSMRLVGRSVTALAIGAALTISGASLASAGSWGHGGRWDGGNLASGKVSAFNYANVGTGGYVTSFSSTSITVDEWNGTSQTFTLSGTTTYTVGTTSASYSSLANGERVVIGVSSTEPTAASSVTIELAMLFGTVTSVSGNSINIRDFQGFTRNIIVGGTGGTTYTMGGAASSLSAVVVGAKILAEGTIDANGTSLDALTIEIGSSGQMGWTYGTVTGFTSSTLTVEAKDGTSTTFTYTTNTSVKALGDPSATLTIADLANNEHVAVAFDSSAVTTAVTIEIKLAHISGTVSAVSGDNITVQDHQGFTRMILVGATTTYSQNGTTSTTDPVVVGMRIRAEGVVDANGTTLDALTITICSSGVTGGPVSPQFPGGHHHIGGGGNGGGNGGGFGGGFQVSGNHRSNSRH